MNTSETSDMKDKNKHLQILGLLLSFIIVGALKLASHNLQLNIEQITVNADNTITFEDLKRLIGILFGIMTALISLLFSIYFHISIRKTIKKYGEDFKCSFYPFLLFMLFAQFFIGSISGYNTIPALIFLDYLPKDIITYASILAFITFEISAFSCFLIIQYYAIVLTNQQIIGISFNNWIRGEKILLKNIKTVQILRDGYNIISMDGNNLLLRPRPFATKIYKNINKILNRTGADSE